MDDIKEVVQEWETVGKRWKLNYSSLVWEESSHFGSLKEYKGWKKWRMVPNDLHCYLGPLHYPGTMGKQSYLRSSILHSDRVALKYLNWI